ncbi:hypothetical protein IU487_22100 [Nocardia puris]|uniref:hypothetical protein n=1 Tax=Nocardia puris TaxID=208602 RepID=UPI0018954CEB|nr:hypothetical protein [Nocardia puris]MBF6213712.1 hypothetical protein [Nocardia puris]
MTEIVLAPADLAQILSGALKAVLLAAADADPAHQTALTLAAVEIETVTDLLPLLSGVATLPIPVPEGT